MEIFIVLGKFKDYNTNEEKDSIIGACRTNESAKKLIEEYRQYSIYSDFEILSEYLID